MVSQAFDSNKKRINLFALLCSSFFSVAFCITFIQLLYCPSKFPCYLFICVSERKFSRWDFVPAINTFLQINSDRTMDDTVVQMTKKKQLSSLTQPLSIYVEFCHRFLAAQSFCLLAANETRSLDIICRDVVKGKFPFWQKFQIKSR